MESKESASEGSSFTINPETHIGHIHLRVSNIENALRYYRDLLGFRVSDRTSKSAFLTVDDSPSYLIALSKAAEGSKPLERHAGLYHFAILLPDRKSLASILRHLMKRIEEANFDGAADHGVSEALYLRDPDGNGIEIYRDRPRTEWSWSSGKIGMTTQSLDEEDLLQNAEVEWRGMPAGTVIGHVHLQVSNLPEAEKFYSETLGLRLTCTYPGAYFYAADDYHHHIATNIWQGEDILPTSKTQPGLDHFALVLPDTDALHALLRHISIKGITTEKSADEAFSHSVNIFDPDGIKIQLHG